MVAGCQLRCAMPSPVDLAVDVTVHAEVELPPALTEDALASLAGCVLVAEGVSGDWQFGIRFVDDPAMQQAHAEFMRMDSPTDIMTFPYEDEGFDFVPGAGDVMPEQGGDLMISVDRAADHAVDAGWGTDQELFFVVVHGILHILGWDDATDDERSEMLDRQQVLLSAWNEGRCTEPE